MENGYTRVANELMEAVMRFQFNKRELKIILYIIRNSYGYHRKYLINGANKHGKIAQAIGLGRPHVTKTLNELIAKNVVTTQAGKLQLNKNYKQWTQKTKKVPKRYLEGTKTVPKEKNQTTQETTAVPEKKVPKRYIPEEVPKRYLEGTKTVPSMYQNGTLDPKADQENTSPADPLKIYSKDIYKDREKEVKREKKTINKKAKITFNEKTEKLEGITSALKEKCRMAYSGVNIEAEIIKMELWLTANPKKRKKNYQQFIITWLRNAQGNHKKGERYHGITTRLTEEEKQRIKEDEKNGITSWKAGEW